MGTFVIQCRLNGYQSLSGAIETMGLLEKSRNLSPKMSQNLHKSILADKKFRYLKVGTQHTKNKYFASKYHSQQLKF